MGVRASGDGPPWEDVGRISGSWRRYRLGGEDTDQESVLKALGKTGSVITMAGVIMAIAFAGLIAAHERTITQMGFILVAAVLTDTFVVRAMLIPSLMSILGRANWWPRRMPLPQKALAVIAGAL